MKNSLIILGIFLLGLAIGMLHIDPLSWFSAHASTYILYALMLQIGISIGHSNKLTEMKRQLHWSTLCLPLMTIVGAFLMTSITGFYVDEFYQQMGNTFGAENDTFLENLRLEAAQEDESQNPPKDDEEEDLGDTTRIDFGELQFGRDYEIK